MNTVKLSRYGHTKMIAHRGLSGLERENTCAAFVAAGNRSHFGIETDVRQTCDGHLVLCHDEDTARNCVDKLVPEQSTFQTLRRLQYKDIDDRFDRGDLMMPTLAEYIKICKRYEKVCVLELKGVCSQEMIENVLAVVNDADYAAHMLYISFCFDNLLILRSLVPNAEVQWLTSDPRPEMIDKLIAHKIGLDAYYETLNKALVDQLHANGLLVNCWTVDNPAIAEQLVDMGVDMITSNILE